MSDFVRRLYIYRKRIGREPFPQYIRVNTRTLENTMLSKKYLLTIWKK